MTTDQKALVHLIIDKNMAVGTSQYSKISAGAKVGLVAWLEKENFPTDNPPDLVGDTYTQAWFDDKSSLLVFDLDYEEAEQCGGTIVFLLSPNDVCTYVADTVECSS